MEVAEFFERCRANGEMLHLVIANRNDDLYLGEAMLVLGESQVGELGCGILEQARGRGIATTALRMLAEWSLRTLGLGRVQVIVAVENPAAVRLAKRAGFHREGLLRAYWEHHGDRLDAAIFSLLPADLA
jgi:RimJ/RimL family protein N-acetyltransferase